MNQMKQNNRHTPDASPAANRTGQPQAAQTCNSVPRVMNELTVSVVPCSANPIRFDSEKCIGCNTCVRTCHCDVLLPSTEKGAHPIVAWPGECWYCGACVLQCPVEGAIKLEHPLMNRTKFVDAIPEPEGI